MYGNVDGVIGVVVGGVGGGGGGVVVAVAFCVGMWSAGALCPDTPAYLSSQQSDGSCGDAYTDLVAMTSIPEPPGGVILVFTGTNAAAIGTASVAIACDPTAPRFIITAPAGPPARSGLGNFELFSDHFFLWGGSALCHPTRDTRRMTHSALYLVLIDAGNAMVWPIHGDRSGMAKTPGCR